MPWQQMKKVLKKSLPESTYALWIEPLACSEVDEKEVVLACPDPFFCSWVTNNYQALLQESLAQTGRRQSRVRLVVGQQEPAASEEEAGAEKVVEQLRLPTMSKVRSFIRTLHPRYTFDEFVVGESNALAHSACQAIANGDTSLGQCLYIEGGTGLGKSHLTHAVAHHLLQHAPQLRLHYMNAQQLTAEMVRHLKNNAMDQFKEKYQRNCDVLLMEDVHVLAGRTKTQFELAEALDALVETGKLVVLTGVMVPRDIPDMEVGIRSRLSAGLITSLNPPDLPTRALIIRRKAKNNQLALSEELIEYLATNIRGDIRQLESAMIGLKAKTCLLKTAPDRDMVKEVIRNIVGQPQELSVNAIRDFVAGQFKVSIGELQSKSRKKSVAFPRQIAMYLARKHTEQALSNIAQAFNRDHSTVVHSVRVITEAMVRNASVRGQVEHLSEKLRKKYS